MEGTYNPWLVVTSVVVAILAAYTALDMADRVNRSRRNSAILWLLAGGTAMGIGIWSMHFIGMLAFQLPIATGYDPLITLISFGAGMVSSTFALWLVSQATLPTWRVVPGAVLMGLGIASMHYLGMEAMQMQPGIAYHPGWFAASIIVAIVASWTALRIFHRMRSHQRWSLRLAASTLLGFAIVGMHYTGMASARFPADAICGAAGGNNAVNPNILAIVVTLLTVAALGLVLTLSLMDRKLESRMLRMRNAMLSLSLEEANAELSQAALRDPLTRLPNRYMLMSELKKRLSDPATQPDSHHALYVIDLNDFQSINEAYGHAVGDQLLILVGERLGEFIRAGELLARTGSDEFALLTQIQDGDDPDSLAVRILGTLSHGLELEGKPISLTASLGLTTTHEKAGTPEALLSQADSAMREARLTGRNQWLRFSAWMSENHHEQIQLLGELRQAVAEDQLTLLYLPKLRARDNSIAGAEVQLRWEHPGLGQIPGERVLLLAERGGLTGSLGKWMIEQACAQLGLWHRAGQQSWTVSLNLSPLQFQDEDLLDHIRHCLQRHGLPVRSLILEICEGLLVRDTRSSIAVLNSLATLGVGISIDDFGTGHASLLHLKQLPATELKIGQQFIQELAQGSADAIIVSTLIGLVHGLEMDVVADGVSSREQRIALDRMGCDYLQGPLVGAPVSPARFIQLHASRSITVCDGVTDSPPNLHVDQAPPQTG